MKTIVGENRRARLLEYVPWILRDYMMNQGPSTALVVLLIGYMTLLPAMHVTVGPAANLGDVPADIATRMLRAMLPPLVLLGTFFATNGIVSNDRKLAYYRFLFSKPVSPPAYYAAAFATYGLGLLLVSVALIGLWSLTVRPAFPIELFGIVLLMYLSYGGIGFLLSAAWRFDWLSLVTVLLVANVAWSVWGGAEGLRRWVLYLLPPVHRAEQVFAMVLRESSQQLPWESMVWLGGYGLICFVLGMIVIRKRPLGTS